MAEVVAKTIFSSTVYEFLKYCLKKTAERDYFEKAIMDSFWKVFDQHAKTETGAWTTTTYPQNVRLQTELIGCLHSPDIDVDEFLDIMMEEFEKKGLNREEAKKFCAMVLDEFKILVNREGSKNPKVFMALMLHECKKRNVDFEEIRANLDALREEFPALRAVLETSKSQLNNIEREVKGMHDNYRVIMPTIQSVLRKNDPNITDGVFFRKEPAWIDFREGYIVQRREVKDIIEKLDSRNIHLITGEPSSGKSIVLKNIGFKLANNRKTYFVNLKTISEHQAEILFEEAIKMRGEKFLLIVDDAHYQLQACERLIQGFRCVVTKARLLIGSRPIQNYLQNPKQISEFDYLMRDQTVLSPEDVTEEIIQMFLEKMYGFSNKKIKKISEKLSEYKKDLWHLSWALKSYDPKKDNVETSDIEAKIRDSIRTIGQGAEDLFFPLSIFSVYEIQIERGFLEEKFQVKAETIDRLIRLSEINETEEKGRRRAISLPHSSIAELYLGTYHSYPDLGARARIKLHCDLGEEYEMFHSYMLSSDPLNSFDIVSNFVGAEIERSDQPIRRRLLLRLLRNNEIKDRFRIGFEKQKSLVKIARVIASMPYTEVIASSPDVIELRDALYDCIFTRDFPKTMGTKIDAEDNLDNIASFFAVLSFRRSLQGEPFGIETKYPVPELDVNLLLQRLQKEKDVNVVEICLASVYKLLQLPLERLIDIDKFSSVIQKEQNGQKVLMCLFGITYISEEIGLKLAEEAHLSRIGIKDVTGLENRFRDCKSLNLLREIAKDVRPNVRKYLRAVLKERGL